MSRPTRRPTSACPCARSTQSAPAEPRDPRLRHDRPLHRCQRIAIDVRKGLARTRRAWVLERGGVEEYDGRPIQADRQRQREGRGAAAVPQHAAAAARPFDGKPITQYEWARAGVITKEMIYVAERENLGRKVGARARQGAAGRRRELRRRAARVHHAGVRAPGSRAAAAPSSRPTSTTASSSRWSSAAISW